MKLKKVNSVYKNSDRLINTLRERITTAMENTKRDHEKFKKHIATIEHNAGKVVINYSPGSIIEQKMSGLSRNDIHVGVGIIQIGRIVKVEETLDEKGQPQSSFSYELSKTKVMSSVIITGDELEENKKRPVNTIILAGKSQTKV